MTRNLVLAGLCLGLLLAAPQPASAGPKLTYGCLTITTPGSWILGTSIAFNGPTCFVIAADDVKLDLDGHTLTGNDGTCSGNQQAITDNGVARRSIEITNGAITGTRRAIDLRESENVTVSWMRIDDNCDGINLGDASMVFKNIVTDSEDDGIRVKRESIVHDNIANDNGSDTGGSGIRAEKNSLVKNNVTQNNAGPGLDIECPSLIVENVSRQNFLGLNTNGGCTQIDNVF